MVLNNYYRLLAAALRSNSSSWISGGTAECPIGVNGVAITRFIPSKIQNCLNLLLGASTIGNAYDSTNGNATAVIFGDGSTPPTANDYKFAGSVISNLKFLSSPLDLTDQNDVITQKRIFTITNNNANAITISEVGITCNIFQYTQDARFIVERTVLDTPVTIPAGGIGQVVYTITFNLPTAT